MKSSKSLLLFTTITFLASSCTFYKPTLLTTPIVEKGDIIIGGSTLSSTDGVLLYSPIDHLAVKAEAGTSYTEDLTTEIAGVQLSESISNVNYEFAAGFYDTLSKNLRYEVYAGYAFGESGSTFDLFGVQFASGFNRADYTNPFVQSSIQFGLSNNIYFGINLRANFLEYSNYETINDSLFQNSSINEEFNDPNKFVGQVGMDLRYRGHTFGIFLGAHHAFSPEESAYFEVRNFNINFGLYLRLNELFKI
ncbi:MAG: hypothetical protein CMP59_02090 [Flavobacteriales bacterium]|nr:hypothetical protein [Flavobacteriales bacterium]|tara:strand:- start:347 stop:1096 length:750 start_codon:yes stop_codon:yes gene_type:complete